VSINDDMTRMRGEVMERVAAGVGLIAQGLNGLSGVLHHAAQAMEQISETLVSDAVDEEFADDLADREEDEDAKDAEDSLMDQELEDPLEEDDGVVDEMDAPHWMGPGPTPTPPAPDVTGIAEPPHAEPYEAPTLQEHDNPFGTRH